MVNKKESLDLKTVVGGILRGLREAKHLGDLESIRLHKTYKKNPVLARLSAPAFSISDMEVELHFAIAEPSKKPKRRGEVSDFKVDISTRTLKALEPHQVHVMKIKINPIALKVYEKK